VKAEQPNDVGIALLDLFDEGSAGALTPRSTAVKTGPGT
jgi:hypothetical protein